jgi:hypothetical protein
MATTSANRFICRYAAQRKSNVRRIVRRQLLIPVVLPQQRMSPDVRLLSPVDSSPKLLSKIELCCTARRFSTMMNNGW